MKLRASLAIDSGGIRWRACGGIRTGIIHPELVELIAEACAADTRGVEVEMLCDYLRTLETTRRSLADGN